MSFITTTIFPAEILQPFDRILLHRTDLWKSLYDKLDSLVTEFKQKYKPDGRRMREYLELIELYKALYEWKKNMEAYQKAPREESKEKPTPPIERINLLNGGLGSDLRSAFKMGKVSRKLR